ncbi:MAG: S1C family serine protease [Candidatus Falkowbacteria bacterium]|nr:S1C family serine protease [Candidatus Falkowbacteria bacterium]
MFNSKKNFYLFLILIIGLSLAAGILGEILSRSYLLPASNIFGNQELDLNSYNNSNLIIRDAKKVVVNQDLKVSETFNSVQVSLIKIFKLQTANSKVKKLAYYDLDKALAAGFIMTSDGWVALNISPTELEKTGFKKESLNTFLALDSDKKEYVIDSVAANKSLTDVWVFIHLKNVNNLAVRKILDFRSLQSGQSLLVINSRGSILPSFLVNKRYPQIVRSSDLSQEELVLADALGDEFKNSFIFDLNGDLLAWVDTAKKIWPAQTIDLSWQSLMKSKTISSAGLGLYYLDLDKVKLVSGVINYGALIYPNENGLAFSPDSPALKAGLKVDDIILRFDSQELRGDFGLSEALANHKAGDVVTLTYWRAGQEKDLDVKLGELK